MEKLGLYLKPFQRKLLLKNLEADLRPEYRCRIEIMLLADSGQSQAQICKALGCCQETARHWIVMAQTGQAHHWNDRLIGRPKSVSEEYLTRLKELASHSPRECDYPFERWTAQWLSKHLAKSANAAPIRSIPTLLDPQVKTRQFPHMEICHQSMLLR